MTSFRAAIFLGFILNSVYIIQTCELSICGSFRQVAELSFNREKSIFCRSLENYLVCFRKLSADCIHDNHVQQVLSRYIQSCRSNTALEDNDLRISFVENIKKGVTSKTDLFDDAGEKAKKRKKKSGKADDLYDDIGDKTKKRRKSSNKPPDDLYDDLGEKGGRKKKNHVDDKYDDIGEQGGRKKKNRVDDKYDDIGEQGGRKKKNRVDDKYDDIGEQGGRKKKNRVDDKYDDVGDDKDEKSGVAMKRMIDGFGDVFRDKTGVGRSRGGRFTTYDKKWNNQGGSESRFGQSNMQRSIHDTDESEDDFNDEKYFEFNDEGGRFVSHTHNDWDSHDEFDDKYNKNRRLHNNYDSDLSSEENYSDSNRFFTTNQNMHPIRRNQKLDDYFDDIFEANELGDDLFDNGYIHPGFIPNTLIRYQPPNPWAHRSFNNFAEFDDLYDDVFDENVLGMDDLDYNIYPVNRFNNFNENMYNNYKQAIVKRQREVVDAISRKIRENGNNLHAKDDFSSSDEAWLPIINKRNKMNSADYNEFVDSDILGTSDDFDEEGTQPYHFPSSYDEGNGRHKQRNIDDFLSSSAENSREWDIEDGRKWFPKFNFLRKRSDKRIPQLRKPLDSKLLYRTQETRTNFPRGLKFMSDNIPLSEKLGVILDEKPGRLFVQRSEGFSPSVRRERIVKKEIITKTSNDNIKPEQILTETPTGTDANNMQNPELVLRGTSSMTDTSGIRYQGLVLKGTPAKTDINDIRNQGLVLREIPSKTDTNIIRNPELVLGGTPTRTEKHMRELANSSNAVTYTIVLMISSIFLFIL